MSDRCDNRLDRGRGDRRRGRRSDRGRSRRNLDRCDRDGRRRRRLPLGHNRTRQRLVFSHRTVAGGGGAHIRACAIAPGACQGTTAGRTLRNHAQHVLDHLSLGQVIAAHVGQPALIHALVVHAVVAARHAAQQRHADLRAKARGQVQRVLHGVATAAAEVESAQVGVHFLIVGNRRHNAVFQNLDRDHVFHARAHRVAGEALGVADDDLVGGLAKGIAQGEDFRRGAAAAGGRVGLMRDKGHLRGHAVAVEAKAALGPRHQAVHHVADVTHVQPRAVEGAVGGFAAQHFDDAAHAALAHGVFALDHKRTRPHAQQRAVAAAVKGQRRFLHLVVGGGGAGCEEARTDPAHQVFAGHIVCAEHDHTAAAAIADPVLGQRHALRCGGAGSVDMRVRPACTDVLSELAVAHGQDAEDKAAVKLIGRADQFFLERAQLAVQLAQRSGVLHIRAQFLQHADLLTQILPGVVAFELVGEAVAAREGAGKNHAGFIAQSFGQQPAVGQVGSLGRRAVGLHKRDAGFAQGVDTGGNRELRRDVERLDQLGRHAVLFGQVKCTAATGQLDHVVGALDHLEAAAAVLALDEAGDALVRHLLAKAFGDQVDELLAAQDAQGIVGVHHLLVGPRQAQARAGDNNRALRCVVAVIHRTATAIIRIAAGDLLQGGDQRLSQRPGVKRRLCHDCTLFWLNRRNRNRLDNSNWNSGGGNSGGWNSRQRPFQCLKTIAGGIQSAQRLVEALNLARLGVVGKQRPDFRLAAQYIIDKALERALGADFDKHAHAVGVHRLQALHPLHRRSDLQFKNILDLFNRGRIAFARDVGDHLQLRRADAQAVEHGAQRCAGRGDDLRVEGMADGDALRAEALLFKQGDGLFDGLAGPTHHSLRIRIDVGGYRVAVHFLERLLHHIQRSHDGCHPAVVAPAHLCHLGPACSGGFECIGKGHDLGGNQRAILTQRMAHDHVRLDAVLGQQLVDCRVDGQHGRLRDRRLHQVALGLLHGVGVGCVDKDVVGQRLAQDGRHDLVGLLEGGGHDRFGSGQQAAHVGVLAALTGEQEAHLAGFVAGCAEDALCLQGFPGGGVVKAGGLARLVDLGQQFVMAAKVDHHALGHTQHSRIGQRLRRRPAVLHGAEGVIQLVLQFVGRTGPQRIDAAQRLLIQRLAHADCASRCDCCSRCGCAGRRRPCLPTAIGRGSGSEDLGFILDCAGHVFLDDYMEIGAAKAIGADAGATRAVLRSFPRARLVEQIKGRVCKIDVRIGPLAVERGRQHLVVNCHHRLEQPSRAGPSLEVADVALGRAKPDAVARRAAKHLVQAVDFSHVAYLGACAVRLDQRGCGRVQVRIFPGAPGGQNLADRVGGGDALALAV